MKELGNEHGVELPKGAGPPVETVARRLYQEGGRGALEAAKERGIWGIGVDVDQSHLGRHILTSAVKRLDVAVFNTTEELVRGTLETGRTSRFSLENRGVGLGTISAGVPRSLKAEIEDVRAEIVAGKIPIASSVTHQAGP